jgi:hypothetical protein
VSAEVYSCLEEVIARPPDQVAEFLMDPRSAVLIGPNVHRCFRAPDHPAGAVGEQHLYVETGDDGRPLVGIEEITALDLPHAIETRNLTSPADLRVRYSFAPHADRATRYRQEVWATVSQRSRAHAQALLDAETHRSVARIKEVLESGWALGEPG